MSLESITQQVKAEIAKLTQVLRLLEGTGVKQGIRHVRAKAPRRKMSAASRKRIAAAQRARWAKIKGAQK
jgi:hypothetical protein